MTYKDFVKTTPKVMAIGLVAAALVVGRVLDDLLSESDIVMIFLIAVVCVAYSTDRVAVVLASVISVVVFNFFFVSPRHTLLVDDLRYIVTFVVMGALGLMVSSLVERVRKQAESALRRQSALEQETLRNSLLSSVSHDLRTPIASIVGNAELLQSSSLAPQTQSELLESVISEGRRLESFLNNVLETTRLEGQPALRKEWTPVEELVGAALHRLKGRAEGFEIETVFRSKPQWVFVDERAITSVIFNLVENALKFSPPGTRVQIVSEVGPQSWTFAVRDQGSGFELAEKDALFQRFYRASKDSKTGGSGLGLAIVKVVVESHDGTVLASAFENGSSFGFKMPMPEIPDFLVHE